MLNINFIRDNLKAVKAAAKNKGYVVDFDLLLKLDDQRKELISNVEKLKTEQNQISNTKGQKPSAEAIAKSKKLKTKIELLTPKLNEITSKYEDLLLLVPNVPTDDTPIGPDETGNVEIKTVGKIPKFNFDIKDQTELGYAHNLMDNERAVKMGGTRSYITKNEMVILEQSVLRYALDTLRSEGFEIMNVPVMVKKETLIGSGFFPFGKEDVYKLAENDYLVGTSEASLVYYHSNETLTEDQLPRLLSGITTCFRKEVGTYGKDTKGVFRVHQFNKVEQVVLCKPEDADKMFNFILGISEKIVSSMGLPYRLLQICTGDMGAKNAKQVDIEVWFPGQGKYRETHSCSMLTDYQARRANIKYRDQKGDKEFVYTLNNTAIATPRILGAIIENNQQKDGSIKIPEVLVKYTGFSEIK